MRKGRAGSGQGTSDPTHSGSVVHAGEDLLLPDDPRVVPHRDPDMPDREQLSQLRAELRADAQARLLGMAAARFRIECVESHRSLDWRILLRQWMLDRVNSDWNSWPYSKKHLHRGLYLPSIGVHSPGHVVFAIDTSASMSGPELASIGAEIRAFRETFPCRLTVIQADDAIRQVQAYEACDGTEMPGTLDVRGRGGTDFRPVFKWLESQHAESACPIVIYATDGYGTFPGRVPGCPVIWLMTTRSVQPSRIPFGVQVRLG